MIGSDEAETLALRALGFLAADIERLGGFLAQTGLDPASIRGLVRERGFHAAVLDHLAQDESLLVAFATNEGLDPSIVMRARDLVCGPAPGPGDAW
jgi:hypothetical protein